MGSSKVKQGKSKGSKKVEDSTSSSTSSVATDPLSAAAIDPLSLPPSSDPLSAALLDPLSQAAAEASSPSKNFGAKPEKVRGRGQAREGEGVPPCRANDFPFSPETEAEFGG